MILQINADYTQTLLQLRLLQKLSRLAQVDNPPCVKILNGDPI